VDSWHEIAWQKWQDEMARGLPEDLCRVLNGLTRPQQMLWLERFIRPVSPCAKVMIQYLKIGEANWFVAPALEWDRLETPLGVLIAYPAPLGEDPLAMAAIGLVWAGNVRVRLDAMVQKLGTTALFACYEAQLPYTLDVPYTLLWESYIHNFELEGISPSVQQFFTQAPERRAPEAPIDWGPKPSYHVYLDELNYGVVPHETSGESPGSIPPVLQALHYVAPPLRRAAALLAFKAIEGRILSDQWRKAALKTRQNEVNSW
jgi:hypothetical protein